MRYFIFTILSFYSTLSIGQFNSFKAMVESDLERAYSFYEDQFYEEAITYYTRVNDQSNLDAQSYLNLADSYRRMGQLESAWTYYKATDDVHGITEEVGLLNYAEVLLSTGRLEEAKEKYELYEDMYPGNIVVANKLAGLLVYDEFYADSAYTIMEPSPLNSEHREFGLRTYGKGMAFTSSREKDLVIQHDYRKSSESGLDIYLTGDSAGVAETSRVKLSSHFKSNDGPFSQSRKQVVVSRSNGYSKEEDSNTLGLYFYTVTDNGWEFNYGFPHNSSTYTVTHPAFNPSGDTLYFASNMPGGFGSSDIYLSVKSLNGWTRPQNLGEKINTPGEETFPFHDGRHFYFSSNGHPGIGGLDVYEVFSDEDGLQVVNMGYPMNTGYDDFSIFKIGDTGNIASNRKGGKGLDDIYEFTLLPKPPPKPKMAWLDIGILDSLNGRGLDSVHISVQLGQEVLEYLTDSLGNQLIELPPGDYTLNLSHAQYKKSAVDMHLVPDKTELATVLLTPDINLDIIAPDSILFEFGKYELVGSAEQELDQIVNSMTDYPMLVLTIEAHTDSKGKSGYNQWLSERRAESAAEYLESNGIESARITEHGLGESKLLNNCTDGVPCSPQEHAVNRRIEFILTKAEDD